MNDLKKLSDKILLEQCERFGREALLWRNKFRALLPEIDRRRLYFKKGYKDIFEFGMRLAGLSELQVSESLNIALRLEDKPALRGLLERGEVSVNKIIRVMPIVTIENEEELAEKVQLMSLSALKVFVRDVKLEDQVDPKSKSNIKIIQNEEVNEFGLNNEVIQRLEELRGKGIDVNEALTEFLNEREQKIQETKDKVVESLPAKSSRYIPARVINIIKQEHGKKCSKTGCNKPSREIHHARRYSLDQSHDPNFMAPLCREHHQIAHMIDVRVQECRGVHMRHQSTMSD